MPEADGGRRLGRIPKTDQIGHQPIGAVGPGRQLAPEAQARRKSIGPAQLLPRPARRAWGPCCTGNGSSSSSRSTICGSRPAVSKKYSPRSCRQPFQSASVMRFGVVKTGCCGCSSRTTEFSSVTRSRPTLPGIRPVLRLVELELVVVDDDGAAGARVVDQALVVGAQIGAALVGAHAGHHDVEAIAGRPTPDRRRRETRRARRAARAPAESRRRRPSHTRSVRFGFTFTSSALTTTSGARST